MLVKDIFENGYGTDTRTIIRSYGTKDSLIKRILVLVRDGEFDTAKKYIAAAKTIGRDYPEFEKIAASIGKAYKRGAHYAPGVDAKTKTLVGSTDDWKELFGASDADVKEAMAKAKQSPFFAHLKSIGLIYTPRKLMERNGTFNFLFENEDSHEASYHVHANGQIRRSVIAGYYRTQQITKIKSPPPEIFPGDPVKTMLHAYLAAFERLIQKPPPRSNK